MGVGVAAPVSQVPLVVDLDGTLLRTDTLHESAIRLLRDHPLDLALIPLWLTSGKAYMKRRIAGRITLEPSGLPYRQDLLEWLRAERDAGRTLVLCTAADCSIATAVSEHLGIFDAVMSSDGTTNLDGPRKADALVARFGAAGFDYAGNSSADLPVWARARRAIVVDAPGEVARQARGLADVEREFAREPVGPRQWGRVLRVHQWLKNLLLFVPLVGAHRFADGPSWQLLALAFLSFSLCASAVYVGNDLLDLDSDRAHPRKRYRPFASGAVSVKTGAVLVPVLILASLLLGVEVGEPFLFWLATYFLLTCVYTLLLKRLVIVDCLTLALLYTVRIVAGAAAASLTLSFWMLAFAMFLFLSLAFVKRYAELMVQADRGSEKAHGRGYLTADAPLVEAFGVASGYGSALVLALYLNSEAVTLLYRQPQVAGGVVPIVLFWISWVWIQAHRGRMNDDPLVFAVRDPASLAAGVAFAAVLALASAGLPW
jgi:4-hydroxybenzoate polyprenyltransferase